MQSVTFIHNVAVETSSILTAMQIAIKAQKKDAVRGTIIYQGKKYRWSTLQQYKYHDGFTAK